MAFITISGYPCSGKSTVAQKVKDDFERRLQDPEYKGPALRVVIVSDESLSIPRSAYNDSRSEKPARGALLTAVQRNMNQDTILIVDAPNYIKGFRYQMYCAAREAKLRVCTLYTVATADVCRSRNEARQEEQRYAPETLENMIARFEEPSSMVRWDSPLFTITWTDEELPMDRIWDAATHGNVKPPNAGTQAVVKAPTSALQALEQTTTALVSAISTHPSVVDGLGGKISLAIPGLSDKVELRLPPRTVTLPELQRLKRQFVTVHKKAITLGTTEKGTVDWSEGSIARKFAAYVEENVRP
ncbi:chromatin associated protein KTI12 [Schizophyllum commune H4-8]|uniref:Chromatin associated protein KTI12 n=1 Tax=Schizophyllum commune (strain H4-8 / FGSC 9210) TaxID=578458 RepID=D8Q8H1_SCHCM|nr:chromatin associated protein KTI12 [Schizophyllum commune H4-8]KAI5890815.1 chromatin associated protein KTI12 [Schizophyllum commune H4-8]